MSDQKQVVLSPENIDLLAALAESLGSAEEVRRDPNFALFLLLSEMRSRPGGDVVGVRLDSLAPTALQGARERIAQGKAA